MQLVLQHCCKTSWIAMLRVLPLTFKPVNNLICCKTGLMHGGKTLCIAIQLVLQQCCKTSCMFFVARISVSLFNTKLKLKSKLLACECRHISHHHFSPPRWKEVTTGNTSARLTYQSLLFSLQTVPATECMHTASQHICKWIQQCLC